MELSHYEQELLENKEAYYWKERFKSELARADGLKRLQTATSEKLQAMHTQCQHLLDALEQRDGG